MDWEVLSAKAEYLESRLMWNAGEVDRLNGQVASLLTTLTQDDFPDPAILHAQCRGEVAWLTVDLEAARQRETMVTALMIAVKQCHDVHGELHRKLNPLCLLCVAFGALEALDAAAPAGERAHV